MAFAECTCGFTIFITSLDCGQQQQPSRGAPLSKFAKRKFQRSASMLAKSMTDINLIDVPRLQEPESRQAFCL
jgi:hypothetical protein